MDLLPERAAAAGRRVHRVTALGDSIVALAPAAENAARHAQPVTLSTAALQADERAMVAGGPGLGEGCWWHAAEGAVWGRMALHPIRPIFQQDRGLEQTVKASTVRNSSPSRPAKLST
jgi:hypothetical protein